MVPEVLFGINKSLVKGIRESRKFVRGGPNLTTFFFFFFFFFFNSCGERGSKYHYKCNIHLNGVSLACR